MWRADPILSLSGRIEGMNGWVELSPVGMREVQSGRPARGRKIKRS